MREPVSTKLGLHQERVRVPTSSLQPSETHTSPLTVITLSDLDPNSFDLEVTGVIDAPGATHLTYRVGR
jgi:hypothetical protein